jgi:hypothetical protein
VVLVACSELDGQELGPYESDDAAVLLRAGQLVEQGSTVRAAIAEARMGLLASRGEPESTRRFVGEKQVARTGDGRHGDPYRHVHFRKSS